MKLNIIYYSLSFYIARPLSGFYNEAAGKIFNRTREHFQESCSILLYFLRNYRY